MRRSGQRFVLLAFTLGACAASNAEEQLSPELTAASATIENGLAYDGCSYPIEIYGMLYAPDAQSVVAIQAAVDIGKTSVQVDYRVTGRTGRVECGWNTHQDLPEIEVVITSK